MRGAIAAVAAATVASLAAQTPVFRGGIELVNVGVTVSDRHGNYISGLTPDDFEIVEDGTKQAITFFARGEESGSAPELHVGLLFDTEVRVATYGQQDFPRLVERIRARRPDGNTASGARSRSRSGGPA